MAHDPGGKVKLPLLPGTIGDAAFSDDGVYRYWLMRDWSGKDNNWKNPFLLSVGTNPSTAEKDIDDPTIRKGIKYAKCKGFTRYVMCNAGDYRSTDPKLLPSIGAASKMNFKVIRWFAKRAGLILCCWGKAPKQLWPAIDCIRNDLDTYELWCLGTNKDGSPKHPLYLPDNTPFERFD